MAIEGLVRDIATLEGQRAAAPGQIFSGIAGGIAGGIQAVGKGLEEERWQKQLELGKQGVLDMAQKVGLDQDQLNMLNNAMTGKSGVDRESMNKMYVLVNNMKTAKEEQAKKEAAATAEKERFGRLVEPLTTSGEISTVPEPGQTLREAQLEQGAVEGLKLAETTKDIKTIKDVKDLLGREDSSKADAIDRRHNERMARGLNKDQLALEKQALNEMSPFVSVSSPFNTLEKVLTPKNFNAFTKAIPESIRNIYAKGLEKLTDEDLDSIRSVRINNRIGSLINQILLKSMESIKGAASDRDLMLVANSIGNPRVADYQSLRQALKDYADTLNNQSASKVGSLTRSANKLDYNELIDAFGVKPKDGGFDVRINFKSPSGKTQKEAQSKKVNVRLPDGRIGKIPESKLKKALEMGAEVIK